MKAAVVLAVMLMSVAVTGCVSREIPVQPTTDLPRPAGDSPAEEQRTIVAHLLEAHNETVDQMRVSAALRPQQQRNCN